jgi:hypothetical protein
MKCFRWLLFLMSICLPLKAWSQIRDSCVDGGDSPNNGVSLYDQANFKGRCSHLTDSHANLSELAVGNDAAASIRIVGPFVAIVYRDSRFRGPSSTYIASDPNFGNDRIGVNNASSIRILKTNCNGEPGVYLYQHSDYQRRCSRFSDDVADFAEQFIQPDAASSIRFVGDWEAVVFSSARFGGGSALISSAIANLGQTSLGHDRARSIQVTPTA